MPRDLWLTEYDSRTLGMHAALAADPRAKVAVAFCHSDEFGVPDFGMLDSEGRLKPSATAFLQASKIVPEKEEPVPKTTYKVGQGILDAMAAKNDEPATDELYTPSGKKAAQWSEAMGKSGTIYRYLFDTNETHSFAPDD